ncbi:extracellular solute-binding protein [Psychromarinibacter halotolerans]|nr:extracellular solute-binding protein [Psychromarinibacter halotolerans]MDF0597544.1 extracellular solute-binding protein [Psychromarinibacter halotolerans]
MNRRTLLKYSGGTALTAALASPATIARAAETLVVNSQGGEYQEIFERVIVRPFEEKFGVTVINDATGSASQDLAKIRASGGSPGFDVAASLTPPEIIVGGREGLLESLDETKVPNLAHVWEKTRALGGEYGAVHTVQYASLIYNTEKVDAPTSWADYWTSWETYGDEVRNHLIGFNPANLLSIFALIHAAELGGGGVENMEPAWEMLAAQKPYLGVVVTGSSEAVPHFENGQVWVSPYWSGRAALYIDRGLPFEMVQPKEGVLGLPDVAAVPSGAQNKDLAYEFINFRLSKEVQREFSLAYHAGPGRNDIDDFPQEFLDRQIASEDKMANTIFPDLATIGEKRRDWTLRWQEVMS